MPPTTTEKYICDYSKCTYSFAKRAHLDRHRLTHTNIQKFSCPLCERKFARNDSRDRHLTRLHPNLIVVKTTCNKSSNYRSGRTRQVSSGLSQDSGEIDDEEAEAEVSVDNGATCSGRVGGK
jgi:uncharacterized Zn-finger protein